MDITLESVEMWQATCKSSDCNCISVDLIDVNIESLGDSFASVDQHDHDAFKALVRAYIGSYSNQEVTICIAAIQEELDIISNS